MTQTENVSSKEEVAPARQQTRVIRHTTFCGLAVNLILAGLKFVVGLLGASPALVADAVHSLSDSVTDLAVLLGAPYWAAEADADHPYGHARIETVFTVVIGCVLGIVGLGLIYNAGASIPETRSQSAGWWVLLVACISMVSKEVLYRWSSRIGQRIKSPALIANAWHHRSDGFSSLPVAIAVLGRWVKPDWAFLENVAALIVSVFILQAAWKIIWPALRQLVDSGVNAETRDKLLAIASSVPEVQAVHAIRTRRLGPGLQVDLHVQVDPQTPVFRAHQTAHLVKDRLFAEGSDVVDVLVHIEPFMSDSN
jgi:cation diffusion facilitator family transporter